MEVSILGPLKVWGEGGAIDVGGPRRRALLTRLAVAVGRVVPADRLIEDVWGDDSPASASTLQSHISHLRRALGADRLGSEAGGYCLRVPREEIDSAIFEDEVREGRRLLDAGAAGDAAAVLGAALARWRGPALADAQGAAWAEAESARLEELRLVATESLFDAHLAQGHHRDVIGEAEAAVAEHPLRERLWAQLILALYRCGRQAEALRAFQRLRATLGDELGIDPSPDLRELEAKVLAQHEDLDAVAPDPAAVGVAGRGLGVRSEAIMTFLFTDVAGSTRLWERHPAEMARALERHDTLSRCEFEGHRGYVFATTGDGFAVAFARPSDALGAATSLQHALARERWPEATPIGVRMALHTGEAIARDGDYFGTAVNTAARLLAVGHAGQVLVSDATRQLLGDTGDMRDLGVHRLRDLGMPMRVWQVGDEHFGSLRSVNRTPGNLPRNLPVLIGRDAELFRLVDAMSAHRLITLTGVGGVGKTRLALGVAGEVAPDLAEGCWFVDLSTRQSDDDLAAAVSDALGAEATATDRQFLFEHLHDRRMLVVLDNCEHVIDAAAELAEELLSRTHQVVLLVTSREPLGIDGEHVHRVRSLRLPDADAPDDGIAVAPAVALFLARMDDAAAPLDVTGDVRTVAEICRHLDGIPLAIELAAARTRSMSPVEILTRIDERFRLLGGGRRSRDRHRTLVATVRWSHDLLSLEEQTVWRRLAVFVGGFDLPAAEAVVGRPDTIEAVLSLVDKSMVQADTAKGRTRYSMLETLRQFAADRLVDAGEVDEIRDRYADHYLQRYGFDAPPMRGPDESETWKAVAADRSNVIVAAERLLEAGQSPELIDAMTSAPSFWMVTAPAEGAWLLERATSGVHDDELAARALGLAAYLAWEGGDPAESLRLARGHLTRCADAVTPPSAPAIAATLIMGSFDPSVVDDDLIAAAMSAAEREHDLYLRVTLNSLLGIQRRRRGDPDWRSSFEDAAAVAEQMNSGSAFVTLAVTRASEELRGDGGGEAAAAEILSPAEHHANAVASTPGGWFHLVSARVLFDLDPAKAARHLHEAIRAADQLGAALLTHLGYEGVALARAMDGRLADAAVLRAVTRMYFDTATPRLRGEVLEPIRARVDAALAVGLDADERAAAETQAQSISRQELLGLALDDVRTHDPC